MTTNSKVQSAPSLESSTFGAFQNTVLFTLAVVVTFLMGCASNFADDYSFVDLPALPRHPVAVELQLSEEFKTHKLSKGALTLEMGRTLTENAQRTARAAFLSPTTNGSPQAILTATVVDTNELWEGTTSASNAVLSVVIEWRLQDLEGNLIWLGTEAGRSESPRGVSLSPMFDRAQLALDQVFVQSAHALANATVIQDWSRLKQDR